MTAEQRD